MREFRVPLDGANVLLFRQLNCLDYAILRRGHSSKTISLLLYCLMVVAVNEKSFSNASKVL